MSEHEDIIQNRTNWKFISEKIPFWTIPFFALTGKRKSTVTTGELDHTFRSKLKFK